MLSSRGPGFYASGFVALLFATSLAACAGSQSGLTPISGTQSQAASALSGVPFVAAKSVRPAVKNGVLYVANSLPSNSPSVSIYNTPANNMVGTITGNLNPVGVYVSPNGDLFVVNDNPNSITVYNKAHKLLRTLTRLIESPNAPIRVSFDAKGNAYVLAKLKIVIYPNGKQNKVQGLVVRRALSMTVDAQGNMYVVPWSGKEIDVYPPGAKTPSLVINSGVDSPGNLAIDANGNLYASNYPGDQTGSITVYNAATGTLEYTITQGIMYPVALLAGSDGNLYVGNVGGGQLGSVSVYAFGQISPSRIITDGINGPERFAMDGASNLYVGNGYGTGSVSVYSSGSSSPSSTITQGIDGLSGLAFGN
jgi:hypothetical protein